MLFTSYQIKKKGNKQKKKNKNKLNCSFFKCTNMKKR